MKKGILLTMAAGIALSAAAQDSQKPKDSRKYTPDSLLAPWCIDINILGGMLNQGLTTGNTLNNYPSVISGASNIGNVKFSNGSSFGGQLQLGYFFGNSRNWGVGAGFMYLSQHGDATLDNYHVEFESTDQNHHVYRQLITGSNIKESMNISNMSIPLVAKFKKRFSQHWGFTADAGLLINIQEKYNYSTNASFDYEAIYQSSDGSNFTYDAQPVPTSANDEYWTKSFHANDYATYFAAQRAKGYNVGLGITPNSTTGSASYNASVGFLVSPMMSYYISDNVALNFGLNYIYQPYKKSVANDYQLTNKVGDYNSIMNSVSAVKSSTYGINVGARIFFGKLKDRDHDGVPDKYDQCPDVFGLAKFQGCPDRDGDGIPDKEDACPDEPGLPQFHGCPDRDGDGIPDKEDACPDVPGLAQFHGCPDRDGDGIPDKDDACPDVKGLAQFHGCPDTDGDGIPDNEDNCPTEAGPASNHGCPIPPPPPAPEKIDLSSPVLFDVNKTVIKKSSYEFLDKVADKLKENSSAIVYIDGYTDNTGSKAYNRKLSVKRANVVKRFLAKKGVDAKQMKVRGYGMKDPAASNKTRAGRAENRRVQLKED